MIFYDTDSPAEREDQILMERTRQRRESQKKRDENCRLGKHPGFTPMPDDSDYMRCVNCNLIIKPYEV